MPGNRTGYRYRLDPAPSAEQARLRTGGATGRSENWALADRNEAWLATKLAGTTGLAARLGAMHGCGVRTQLQKERPWLRSISSGAREALKNLDRAFEFADFFARRGN